MLHNLDFTANVLDAKRLQLDDVTNRLDYALTYNSAKGSLFIDDYVLFDENRDHLLELGLNVVMVISSTGHKSYHLEWAKYQEGVCGKYYEVVKDYLFVSNKTPHHIRLHNVTETFDETIRQIPY